MSIALALGQLEEVRGLLIESPYPTPPGTYAALERAMVFLDQAIVASAARVPVAHYTPITVEEVGP